MQNAIFSKKVRYKNYVCSTSESESRSIVSNS